MKEMVTADDFGYSARVNQAVAKLWQKGKIDRVSVLDNLPDSKEALDMISKEGIPAGLHVNLVEGRPLSNPDQISSLVDTTGKFFPPPIFFLRLFLGRIDREDIKREIFAQLKFLERRKIKISHINSHYNVHFFHPVNRIVSEIAKKRRFSIRGKQTALARLEKFPERKMIFLAALFLNKVLGREIVFFERKNERIIHPGRDID